MAVIGYFKTERILFTRYLHFTLTAVNAERSQRKHNFYFRSAGQGICRISPMYDAFLGTTVHIVGWSDLALFSIFENLNISADQVYF